MGSGELQPDNDQHVRVASDKMLDILERLSAVEKAKRELVIGTPQFVEHADEAARLARIAFRWSQVQLQLAQAAPLGGSGDGALRMVDIEPRPMDRILADWREAQLRLEGALPGSPAAQTAADDVERLREEFHAAHERHRS